MQGLLFFHQISAHLYHVMRSFVSGCSAVISTLFSSAICTATNLFLSYLFEECQGSHFWCYYPSLVEHFLDPGENVNYCNDVIVYEWT